MPDIQTKRVYDPADPHDGYRVLVDRVWPRGMSRQAVKADLWLKDAAPSTELRKWFAHEPSKWEAFRVRYAQELDRQAEAVAILREAAAKGRLMLLYSAHDTEHNQAVALKAYLLARSGRQAR
ncbi:MAG: hypothetical protein A2X71_03645 [Thiobacillus sp. GWE1_62_9]|nr:MAG: hypothetical protein A2X71_03645 [Thiobacillus sp. GWE1_62_9]HBU30531.1 hypothetical protein [Thiobacillus sp.]